MEQKRTGLPYVFTLAKEERGKLGLGMLLAVFRVSGYIPV